MENKFFKMFGLNSFVENLQGYFDSKLQIFKIEVQEKLTNIITIILLIISLLFLSSMMLAFFSMALGFYLNSLFESTYLGFLFMGLFFLLLIILLLISKNAIQRKIRKLTKLLVDNN